MTAHYGMIRSFVMFDRLVPAGAPKPIRVALTYDSRDPYAVALLFGAGRVPWLCARDLLGAGLATASGEGDIRLSPSDDDRILLFRLSSPDGVAQLEAPLAEIATFLDRTYDCVPPGEESQFVDLEVELAYLGQS